MDWLNRVIINLLDLDKFNFNKVIINRDVINNIIELAKNAYPKEFIAFLQGNIKNKRLVIYALIYQHYTSSEDSAFARTNFPILSNVVGSAHSHPSHSNLPSKTDLRFFNKQGIIHLIICKPFSAKDIKAYDNLGYIIKFESLFKNI